MRVLVLGAGVLGSYLAYSLLKAGNDVTMLARGKRFDQLKEDGLVIQHYFQRKRTVDSLVVLSELKKDDLYDLIFVVMKYNQFQSIYSTLANNISENIIFVGNNANPRKMESDIQELSHIKKKIGFGFQTSAGMREDSGQVVSLHGKGNVRFGDLNDDVSLQDTVKKAFGAYVKVTIEENIEAWLLTHYVYILPMNSLLYLNHFDTKKMARSKLDLNKMIEATNEGFRVLKESGIPITPAAQENLIIKYKRLYYFAMQVYFTLPMNKLVSGSFNEIVALYKEFEELKSKTNVNLKNWNALEKESLKEYYANLI